MPQRNWAIIVAELLFMGNILCSYPLVINVTNYVIESALFGRMRYSTLRKRLKNLTRSFVIGVALLISTLFYYELPKIMGLSAVLLGTTVVMITPALLHNSLVARTPLSRAINWTIIVYACAITVILTYLLAYFW